MKFLVTWRIHDEHRHDALKTFSEMTADDERADLGDSVNLIGRWHDLVGFTGVAICEADDCRRGRELASELELYSRCRSGTGSR